MKLTFLIVVALLFVAVTSYRQGRNEKPAVKPASVTPATVASPSPTPKPEPKVCGVCNPCRVYMFSGGIYYHFDSKCRYNGDAAARRRFNRREDRPSRCPKCKGYTE